MFEKVSKYHPDKIADRIAGAIVDLAYAIEQRPIVAVEVLIGHGNCNIIIESNITFRNKDIKRIVTRIAGNMKLNLKQVHQDNILAGNQDAKYRCGDNGIFKGAPTNKEEKRLSFIAKDFDFSFKSDGKYIIADDTVTICQSNATEEDIRERLLIWHLYIHNNYKKVINPLGYWTGGTDVDTGATNRKLGSDMGRAVTGGGLHGKDISKADVTINLYCHILAEINNREVEAHCSIGDETVKFVIKNKIFKNEVIEYKYDDLCREVLDYIIKEIGGFEKLAEYGLI